MLPAAVEELMRYQTPVTATDRWASEDIEVHGAPIRAGEHITVSWAAANLDPAVFPDPLTVDFDRKGNRHIAFASGIHRCLGSHLARLELRTSSTSSIGASRTTRSDGETPGRLRVVRAATYLPLSFPRELVSPLNGGVFRALSGVCTL